MNNLKITVIISVYNKLEQLKNILMALNEQEKLPFEVIIVDDGSNEKIEEKLQETIKKLKYKLIHIWQEDIGFRVAASRNNGILQAKGDYILFLDQDILFDTDFLKEVEKNIKDKEVLKMRAIYLDKERTNKINEFISQDEKINFEKIKKYLTKEEYKHIKKRYKDDTVKNILFKLGLRKRAARLVSLGFGSFKRDLLKVNGFDEKYEGWGGEDHDLGNRLSALGLAYRTLKPENILIHMWHPILSGKSVNDEYFMKQEKIILKEKNYKCFYGCDNRLRKEKLVIKELTKK